MSVAKVAINDMTVENRWNIKPVDYRVSGVEGTVDFQDLMVFVSEQRATAAELEVNPLAARIRARNARLEDLGKALSQLSAFQFDTSSSANPESTNSCKFSYASLLTELNGGSSLISDGDSKRKKDVVDKATQLVKTEIDKLNNDSQLDMTRMQSLVDHRDQSFNIATTLMQHVSDSRGTAIKGMS